MTMAHRKQNARNPVSLTDMIVDRFLERIRRRKLMPGKRFGTEQALARELNVSVRAVREAVARLRILGVLDSRQGVGVTVARLNPPSLLGRILPIFAAQSESLEDLCLLRRSLELGVIDLAVRNASAEQIAALMLLAEQYDDVPSGRAGVRRREKLGFAFHRMIFAATNNAFLGDLAEVINRYFVRGAREMNDWGQREDKVTHRQIAGAFKTRNARQAWELMRRHLRMWSADGRERNGEK